MVSLSLPPPDVFCSRMQVWWAGKLIWTTFQFPAYDQLVRGTSYQFSRTSSSLASSKTYLLSNFRQSCVAVNSQHDSSEQRGGGAVTNSIFHGNQSVRLVYETPCVCDSQVRAGEAECSGRLAVEERTDNPP